MSLTEILGNSFLNGYASREIQVADIFICLLVTCALSVYLFCIYRTINKNSFYNRNFNLSLLVLAIIIAAIILTIQSNIVVSLGMVGALSIIRFRTAIKDPMDLIFLFWSISIGIICGAGFAVIAVIASAIVSVMLLFLSKIPSSRGMEVLVINASSFEDEAEIMGIVKEFCTTYKVKARNITKDHLDMAIEVSIKDQAQLLKKLMEMPRILSASLVSHEGDITV